MRALLVVVLVVAGCHYRGPENVRLAYAKGKHGASHLYEGRCATLRPHARRSLSVIGCALADESKGDLIGDCGNESNPYDAHAMFGVFFRDSSEGKCRIETLTLRKNVTEVQNFDGDGRFFREFDRDVPPLD